MGLVGREIRASFQEAITTLKDPGQWLVDWFGGAETHSGVTVNEDTALGATAYYNGIRIIAETVAQIPLFLYRRDGKNRERATDHPAYRLVHDEPNEEMTSFVWRETQQAHVAGWGNGYAHIRFDRSGNASAIRPLVPNRIRATRREDNGKLLYVWTRSDGVEQIFMPGDILHVPGLGFDGITGYTPLRFHRQAIGLSLAGEEFAARFFGGGTSPAGAIQVPKRTASSSKALQNIRQSWEDRNRGLKRSGSVAFLEEDMKWVKIGIDPEDAQVLQSRQFQVAEIARILNLPPHILKDLSRATFSNIEEQSLELVVYSIMPWLVRWEMELNRKLLRQDERRDLFFEFEVMGLLRGDMKSRFEAYRTAVTNAIMSPNEIRQRENLNGYGPAGDVHLVQVNMIPIEQLSSGSLPEPQGSAGSRVSKITQMLSPGPERRGLATRQRLQAAHRPLIERDSLKLLRRESSAIRKIVESNSDPVKLNQELTDFYREHEITVGREMLPGFTALGVAVRGAALDEIAANPDEVFDSFDTFLNTYSSTYAARYAGSSRGQLGKIIAADPDAAAEHIDERLDEWEAKRPGRIGRNESNRLGSATARVAFAAAGITTLVWITVGKNCPLCDSMDGRTVGVKGSFAEKGDKIDPGGVSPLVTSSSVGHPPLHEGCDCGIGPG